MKEGEGPIVDEAPEVLRVRYTGTADQRVLTRRDLSGNTADISASAFVFRPGDEVPWAEWLDLAGDKDRARSVLFAHMHEFQLVGPGSEEVTDSPDNEEFDIGGAVN